MVISKLREMMKAQGPEGPEAKKDAKDEVKASSTNAPVSRSKKKELSEPKAPPAIELNVGPHKLLSDINELENKSAAKILKFYQHGEEVKNKTGDMVKTEAFYNDAKDAMIVQIPAPIASDKLANSYVFKRFTSMFSSFKVNDALTRLKDGNEIDLISEDNEATDPKKMRELTADGVYSFIALHKTNDKGDFTPKADLLVPVMDLHALLEHLKNKVPKGIPKEVHAQFKADVEKLENNPKLQNVKFIDEALALKTNKDSYENPEELRKALCCVADTLSINDEVLVSSDLIGRGKEGKSRGKEYSAFDFNYPVIGPDGKVSIVEHPMTLVRSEDRKSEELPVEQLNRVLQWHFMSQLKAPDKIGKDKEVLPMLGKAFKDNGEVLKKFNQEHSLAA